MTLGDFTTPDMTPPSPTITALSGLRHGELLKHPEFVSRRIKARGHFEWSSDSVAAAVELWDAGKSRVEIADHFNVTLHSITGIIYRNRAKFSSRPRKFSNPKIIHWKQGERRSAMEEAAVLWRAGRSARYIANACGLTRDQIIGVAHRNRDLFPARPNPAMREVAR